MHYFTCFNVTPFYTFTVVYQGASEKDICLIYCIFIALFVFLAFLGYKIVLLGTQITSSCSPNYKIFYVYVGSSATVKSVRLDLYVRAGIIEIIQFVLNNHVQDFILLFYPC